VLLKNNHTFIIIKVKSIGPVAQVRRKFGPGQKLQGRLKGKAKKKMIEV